MTRTMTKQTIAEEVQSLIGAYFSFLDVNDSPSNRAYVLMNADYTIDAIVSASTIMMIDSRHLMKFNAGFRDQIIQSQIDYAFDMHGQPANTKN
jgi:hypothetical protein